MAQKKSVYDEISLRILKADLFKKSLEALLKEQRIFREESPKSMTLENIKFLLESASVFAFSPEEKTRHLGYKIATIIADIYGALYPQINYPIQYIIVSTGLIPGLKKNTQDSKIDLFSVYKESNIPVNPILFKSALFQLARNRISLSYKHEPVYLTDYQRDVIAHLESGHSVSLSAPTSAGKSFILILYLAEKISMSKGAFNVVYIVPTRALINQVIKDFRHELRDFGLEDILITSTPANFERGQKKKKIFVFTQERLHSLLFDTEFDEKLDILIIDEAHKISDPERGILLEEVIEETIVMSPQVQIIFISPFTKNPEKFRDVFSLSKLDPIKTQISPVAQNILLLRMKYGKYKLDLSTPVLRGSISIAEGKVSKKEIPEGSYWQLLWAAKIFGADHNIIYCNMPSTCSNLAVKFAETLPVIDDSEVENVIVFLKDNIHKDYFLIQCLKHGVGYHFGKMPNQVRNLMENLFKNKKIQYLFCTSTLLEGVNLPAQCIFLYKPQRGSKGITDLNFKNLAGRAGRLLKDYYGNIFCINPEEWKAFPNLDDVEYEIESVLEKVIETKDKEILKFLRELYFRLKGEEKTVEQAVTKFIIQEMKGKEGSIIEKLRNRFPNISVENLKTLSTEITKIAADIKIPAHIIQKNSSIHPLKQQELFDYFKTNAPIIPVYPWIAGAYAKLRDILAFISVFFLSNKSGSYKYHTLLAWEWIRGESFAQIITSKINYAKKDSEPTPRMVNAKINELFNDINKLIRFTYQTYIKCYIDILSYYYESKKYESREICTQWPKYLEYGSFDQNVILLQSIGLSRGTAITLKKLTPLTFQDEDDCMNWLRKNMKKFEDKIPPVMYGEIKQTL